MTKKREKRSYKLEEQARKQLEKEEHEQRVGHLKGSLGLYADEMI